MPGRGAGASSASTTPATACPPDPSKTGTIGRWADDAVFAIEALTSGPLVLVGSSMGGWIMMLVARALPNRVAGLVGVAPAPDFTEDLIMANASPALRRDLERDGVHYEPSDYSDEPTPITRRLIEDGRERLVLRAPFPFAGPVRIIQGMADPDVPWRHAVKVAEAFAGADVEIALVRAGDHRLSEPHDLDRMIRTTGEVCRLARRVPFGRLRAAPRYGAQACLLGMRDFAFSSASPPLSLTLSSPGRQAGAYRRARHIEG